jgi:ribonucleoside-diphosphate reductase alpha chain
MMAAVQPFLSGAISKTVNLPESATVEDVERVFVRAWKLGLKAVAVYRNGCKRVQPLRARGRNGNGHGLDPDLEAGRLASLEAGAVTSTRERLPDECRSVRQKFEIAGSLDGYVHAGIYPDGRVGEIFIRLAKEGSSLSGFADALATAVSIGLQYGVPFDVYVEKFSHWRFEPSGYTTDPRIGFAKSIVDYVFRWLGIRFPGGRDGGTESEEVGRLRRATEEFSILEPTPDAPFCANCSTQLRRNGTCFVCPTCGTTTGCS